MSLHNLSCSSRIQVSLITHNILPTHPLQTLPLDHHRRLSRRPPIKLHVKCSVNSRVSDHRLAEDRGPPKYQPNIWNYNFLDSLQIHHVEEKYEDRIRELEEKVRCLIKNENGGLVPILEVIDDIQRLGLGYRFQNEIKRALERIYSWELVNEHADAENKLHAAALRFRLLRRHGYVISQDVFKTFTDDEGKFMSTLQMDVRGMLSLYEASYLAFEGEEIMDEARKFSRTNLNQLIKTKIDPAMSELISHALELPFHHRMPRLESRWYIESYNKRKDSNHLLLELAMLDFNWVQSIYQGDLRDTTRWWKEIDLANKLKFARDRLMECFFWTVGMIPEPQYSNCRRGITKVTTFITTIDDIYDLYGTLDELELFTDAVERWDINAINELPNYMKLSFLALYNTVNEMGYEALKEHGQNVIPYLTKAWADLCKSFLQEAKWSYNKDTPTFEDYVENAWRSASGVLLLIHSYFFLSQNITKEALESLENYHNFLRGPSIIFRLCNDLATSKAELERGETASSIPCYMQETGLSEVLAREHLRNMIDKTWKSMNKDRVDEHPFAELFVETALNLARIAQCTYQYGDAHGAPDAKAKKKVLSLLVEPISFVDKKGASTITQ